MIEIIANSNAQPSANAESQKPDARDDLAVGFSFAAAMTALEGRASQSLQTFGAAPQDAALTKRNAASKEASSAQHAAAKTELPTQTVADKETTTQPHDPKQLDKGHPPSPTTANQPTPASSTQAAAPAVHAAATLAQQSAPTTARTESSAIRDTSFTKQATIKAQRASAPQSPQPATQDFAKLLARRLDGGATSFELRLDPPELGRVEAHLKLGSDGKSVLALNFENQTALDHFAHDEAGLRAALMSSGFDLGGERLAFSLKEDPLAPPLTGAQITVANNDSYEPEFIASFSNGVVDLRV